MNEQLQKELIAILQSMKDGASPAWEILVQQRTNFATTYFIAYLAIALIVGVVSTILMRVGRKLEAEASLQEEGHIFFYITSVIGFIGCLSCSIQAITWLPTAIAPLGQVLNVLNK